MTDYLNNPVASHLEDFADSYEELKKLEKSYGDYYARALVSPFYEGPEFWPEAREIFASFQAQIDALRMELRRPLLWFTENELKEMTRRASEFPAEPRKPYKKPEEPPSLWAAPPAIRCPPRVALLPVAAGAGLAEEPQTVTVDNRTTITLDTLIDQLVKLRRRLGGDAPVWHVEFGGITETHGADEWEGGVVIK